MRLKIEAINYGKVDEYEKDFMKIKFTSDDYLLLNKTLKLHMLTVIVKSGLKKIVKNIHKFF